MIAILFDTETHDRDEPEIIEAAWHEVRFGSPTILAENHNEERFRPSRPIALGAMSTHNIMDEDLIDCPPSVNFAFPQTEYVIGHNVDFDADAAGLPKGAPKRIDTCSFARAIWPNLDCYSQSALIYHLDRANARERLRGAHGAANDILLLKTILDAIIAETKVQSWEELWKRSEEARIPKVMGFGKHKGTLIADLPRSYKEWLLRATDPPIDEYLRTALTQQPKTTQNQNFALQ